MNGTSMQAAVVAGAGEVEIHTVERPEPGAGELRVKLQGCGVCASNLGPWSGPGWMKFPLGIGQLGHEGWGTVDAIGEGVRGWHRGDRVALLSERSFAEYDVAKHDELIRLPRSLAGKPFPGEPLGCAFNIFERSRIVPGDTVAIIGIGFLGAILTRLASAAGARVIAISRRKESLRLAQGFGAERVVPAGDDGEVRQAVEEFTGGSLCSCVIECVGEQGTLDLAGHLVAEGGRLVVAGYHQDAPRQVDMQMWNWKGIDVINAHERDIAKRRRGIEQAIAAVARGDLDLSRLLTHCYPLEQLGKALDDTRDKPAGFVKALILFS